VGGQCIRIRESGATCSTHWKRKGGWTVHSYQRKWCDLQYALEEGRVGGQCIRIRESGATSPEKRGCPTISPSDVNTAPLHLPALATLNDALGRDDTADEAAATATAARTTTIIFVIIIAPAPAPIRGMHVAQFRVMRTVSQ
jgi:hypothetical protein